eukprot:COSAG01_NODE_31937_length_588_cov_0.616327_1_plen_46_part_01
MKLPLATFCTDKPRLKVVAATLISRLAGTGLLVRARVAVDAAGGTP